MRPGIQIKDYGDSLEEVREQLRVHLANSIPVEANAQVLVHVFEKLIDAKMRERDGNSK